MNIKWDWQHTAIMVGSTALGAAANYLQHEPTSAVIAALGSWAVAKPILVGGLGAALVAVVALAKDTFLADAPPAGGAPVIPIRPPPPAAVVPAAPTPPPVVTRLALAVAALALCMLLGGCATLRAAAKDPASAIADFTEYELVFENGVKSAWAVVLPALGSAQASANAAFTKGVAALDGFVAVAQNAAKAFADGTGPKPDLVKLFADVSAAVQQVIATYDQFAGTHASSGLVGAAAPDTMHRQAAVIASWKP